MITLVVTAFLIVIAIVLYFSGPLLRSGDCNVVTSVDMTADPTFRGYEFTIDGVSQLEELSSFEVSILKDNISWLDDPRIVTIGSIAIGPAGEYLNFTDLNSDGNLSMGDFFRLENLTSDSTYEIVLIWRECDVRIESSVVDIP